MLTGIVPSTFFRTLELNGKEVPTDSEGCILAGQLRTKGEH